MKDDIESLIATGLNDWEVAKRAGCSAKTVRRARLQLRGQRKLGARLEAEWQPAMRTHTKMYEPEGRS